MTGGILGFLVFAIVIPLVVNEAGTSRGPWPGVCCGGEPGASAGPTRPSGTRKSGWPIWSGFPAT